MFFEHRVEVVGAVVGAVEAHFDACRLRLCPLEHLVQEGAGPSCGRDCVVAPWLTGGSGRIASRPFPAHSSVTPRSTGGSGSEVVERQRQGVLHRAADLERAVVIGYGKVAAHVVQFGRGDVALECLGRRLGVERRRRGSSSARRAAVPSRRLQPSREPPQIERVVDSVVGVAGSVGSRSSLNAPIPSMRSGCTAERQWASIMIAIACSVGCPCPSRTARFTA